MVLIMFHLGKTQEQGFRRVEELKAELNLIKDAKIDEEKRLNELQTEHATLSEELTKEKVFSYLIYTVRYMYFLCDILP